MESKQEACSAHMNFKNVNLYNKAVAFTFKPNRAFMFSDLLSRSLRKFNPVKLECFGLPTKPSEEKKIFRRDTKHPQEASS